MKYYYLFLLSIFAPLFSMEQPYKLAQGLPKQPPELITVLIAYRTNYIAINEGSTVLDIKKAIRTLTNIPEENQELVPWILAPKFIDPNVESLCLPNNARIKALISQYNSRSFFLRKKN